MEKLYWLNRHYIKQSPPERIERLALPYFIGAGLLPENPDERTRAWFSKVVALLVAVGEQARRAAGARKLIFHVDAAAALASPDNAEVLGYRKRRRARRVRSGSKPTRRR